MVNSKGNYTIRTIDPQVRSYNIVSQENHPAVAVHPPVTVFSYSYHIAGILAVDVDPS
jgi:hypothetical protein